MITGSFYATNVLSSYRSSTAIQRPHSSSMGDLVAVSIINSMSAKYLYLIMLLGVIFYVGIFSNLISNEWRLVVTSGGDGIRIVIRSVKGQSNWRSLLAGGAGGRVLPYKSDRDAESIRKLSLLLLKLARPVKWFVVFKLVPLRTGNEFGTRPWNKILVPFRGVLEIFRRAPPSLL